MQFSYVRDAANKSGEGQREREREIKSARSRVSRRQSRAKVSWSADASPRRSALPVQSTCSPSPNCAQTSASPCHCWKSFCCLCLSARRATGPLMQFSYVRDAANKSGEGQREREREIKSARSRVSRRQSRAKVSWSADASPRRSALPVQSTCSPSPNCA